MSHRALSPEQFEGVPEEESRPPWEDLPSDKRPGWTYKSYFHGTNIPVKGRVIVPASTSGQVGGGSGLYEHGGEHPFAHGVHLTTREADAWEWAEGVKGPKPAVYRVLPHTEPTPGEGEHEYLTTKATVMMRMPRPRRRRQL
jgi:hypothetical protein